MKYSKDPVLQQFFDNRNWKCIQYLWNSLVLRNSFDLPPILIGNQSLYSPFGLTDLSTLSKVRTLGEHISKSPKIASCAQYAVRIGYDGTLFSGYQTQQNMVSLEFRTVQDEMLKLSRHNYICAGRTDKNVSSISQILSFRVPAEKAHVIENKFTNLKGIYHSSGLAVYDFHRVPVQFNARSSATWRRYLYFLPLNRIGGKIDVDSDFLKSALKKMENHPHCYYAFSYGPDATLENRKSYCTLFHSDVTVVKCSEIWGSGCPTEYANEDILAIELVADRFLRQMIRKIVATVIKESLAETRNDEVLLKLSQNQQRHHVSEPSPGQGLGLVGVGYDPWKLAHYFQMPKRNQLELENNMADFQINYKFHFQPNKEWNVPIYPDLTNRSDQFKDMSYD